MAISKGSTLLSVVVPLYNEADGLRAFNESLIKTLQEVTENSYEIIYCDDGSKDNTAELVKDWHVSNPKIKLIKFSRNFGKESALSAGIAQAVGQAIIMLDGDGQHPIDFIPKFVDSWKNGAQVVVGVRRGNEQETWSKRFGSRIFYTLFNRFTHQKLIPQSTDFRLIDKVVGQAFLKLNETDRLTRGLIDWLGFKRELIYFNAPPRLSGSPGYSRRKLIKLAANSFVSLSPVPLYIFGYIGVFITLGSLLLGLSVLIEQFLLGDLWHWKFTGTATLSILLLFLVGVVLMSQGILSLYVSNINNQSKKRPLYIIDQAGSVGLVSPNDE
jgi:dolichol-phosphate mannosyltransferase